jgi:hypothetical protein
VPCRSSSNAVDALWKVRPRNGERPHLPISGRIPT